MSAENTQESFPLTWPTGWPRTRSPQTARFDRGWTLYRARQELQRELQLLGATGMVLSTNIPLRLDGLPYSNSKEPSDHGVAVYFRIKGEPRALACDRWRTVAHNMVALARHVGAIRGQIRWGVGTIEQAFGGYRALPSVSTTRMWFEILGVSADASWPDIVARRNALLLRNHPDAGGSTDAAAEINAAFDQARTIHRARG